MPFPDDDLALPPGSLVLVTGVTGFLASVVADELVKKGYRKSAWSSPEATVELLLTGRRSQAYEVPHAIP